jgi:hypothetical protein
VGQPYLDTVFFIAAYIFAILVWFPGTAYAEKSFSLLGVDFPAVDNKSWLLESDVVPFSPFQLKFDMLFYLSAEGTVDSFSYSPASGEAYIQRIDSSLKNIRFYPATINDTARPFILPGQLLFFDKYGKRQVELQLPYDEPECYKSRALIEKALTLNGFSLPGVARFPSYYCALAGKQDLADYPYTILEIELDSVGTLAEYRVLYSTHENVCPLISNSLLYAEFRPASYKGQFFPCKFYLALRFFDMVNYPTSVWPPSPGPGVSLPYDYVRIGNQLYLDSVINPPFPLNVRGGLFRYDTPVPSADSFEVLVEVDTLGRVRPLQYRAYLSRQLHEVVRAVLGRLRFTPARGIVGEKKAFEGSLTLSADFSKNIRIVINWLPVEAQIQHR